MLTMFRDGGWSMFFVLGFGLALFVAAARFAARPAERHLGFIRWMLAATVLAVVNGTFSDVGTTFAYVAHKQPDGALFVVLEGLAESASPGIMGLALAALSCMLVAIGRARLDARQA